MTREEDRRNVEWAAAQAAMDFQRQAEQQTVIRINQGTTGIGDALLGLIAVGKYKEAHPHLTVEYRVGPRAIPFVSLFDGYDILSTHDNEATVDLGKSSDLQLNLGPYTEIEEGKKESRCKRFMHNLGLGSESPIRMPKLRGRYPLWRADSKASKADPRIGPDKRHGSYVILCPFSNQSNRDYPIHHWLETEKMLHNSSYQVVILDNEEQRCRPFKSKKVIAFPAIKVLSIILGSLALIGNDSGMAHLSAILGHPTCVLFGQTRGEAIFDCYPDVVYLNGHLPCNGCWWKLPYNKDYCEPTCPSLATIAPTEIVAVVNSIGQRKAPAIDNKLLAVIASCGHPKGLLSLTSRPCNCNNVTGHPWTKDQCRRCWLFVYDPTYRDRWSKSLAPAHIPEAAQVRNLLFHLWPNRANDVWLWHLEQLRKYKNIFNGRMFLAAALDGRTVSEARVRQEAQGLFDGVFVTGNNPSRREVQTFSQLFDKVVSHRTNEATLYAHGKGVTWQRGDDPRNEPVRKWIRLLYELYLGCWRDIQCILQNYPLAGSFKKVGRSWRDDESYANWHYSGSWFWFRNADLFSRNWQHIDQFYSGIESYPALHFRPDEAGCLFYEGSCETINLYEVGQWYDSVEPAYQKFLARELPKLDGLKVDLGGGSSPKEGFLNVDKQVYGLSRLDYACDFESHKLPFSDDSCAEVYCSHVLEYIGNLPHILGEIARVCKVGAKVEIRVSHWLSPMAMCYGHKHVIPPQQVDYWCKKSVDYWLAGCKKRFKHLHTLQIPDREELPRARKLYPNVDDETIMNLVPGAAYEACYLLEVIPND